MKDWECFSIAPKIELDFSTSRSQHCRKPNGPVLDPLRVSTVMADPNKTACRSDASFDCQSCCFNRMIHGIFGIFGSRNFNINSITTLSLNAILLFIVVELWLIHINTKYHALSHSLLHSMVFYDFNYHYSPIHPVYCLILFDLFVYDIRKSIQIHISSHYTCIRMDLRMS